MKFKMFKMSDVPNWKQSIDTIEYNQQQQIESNTERIDTLETKTSYDMLNVGDLEVDEVYATTLNVASDSTLHDVGADDISCINCSVSGELNAETISSSLIDVIFKALYPIGSIYVSTISYTPKPITSSSGTWTFDLHGCTFEMIKDTRFVRNCGYNVVEDGAGGSYHLELDLSPMSTGGNDTHTHTYAIRYGLSADNITGAVAHTESRAGIGTYDYVNNVWNYGVRTQEGTESVKSTDDNVQNVRWGVENQGTVSNVSNIPPYICLFVYRRIA